MSTQQQSPEQNNGALYALWFLALAGLVLGLWFNLGDVSREVAVFALPLVNIGGLALVAALVVHALAWVLHHRP